MWWTMEGNNIIFFDGEDQVDQREDGPALLDFKMNNHKEVRYGYFCKSVVFKNLFFEVYFATSETIDPCIKKFAYLKGHVTSILKFVKVLGELKTIEL